MLYLKNMVICMYIAGIYKLLIGIFLKCLLQLLKYESSKHAKSATLHGIKLLKSKNS